MLTTYTAIAAVNPRVISIGCPHVFRRLVHWPATPNPTPYEIFGIEPNKPVYDKRKLRDTYFQLVKLYHPDRGTTGNPDRFKKVVEAHDILKDESKRITYEFNQSQSSAKSFYTRSEKPFEDDMDINYWSNHNQQKFDQGLYESRVWVLKFVTTITVTFAFINFMLMKQASEARNEALSLETEKIAAQLAQSFTNNGKGGDARQRIERFLNDRQRMLDRFDNEFSWEKFKTGKKLNPTEKSGREVPASSRDLLDPIAPDADHMQLKKESSIGKPQMKHHTGPVAEYFGRT